MAMQIITFDVNFISLLLCNGNENLFAPTGLNIKNIGNSTVSIALNWHSLNNAHILGQSSVMVTRILCVCGWLVQY